MKMQEYTFVELKKQVRRISKPRKTTETKQMPLLPRVTFCLYTVLIRWISGASVNIMKVWVTMAYDYSRTVKDHYW